MKMELMEALKLLHATQYVSQ